MADLQLQVKIELPAELLEKLAQAPRAATRIVRRWGKYGRAMARSRIDQGEVKNLAPATVRRYSGLRTSNVTIYGKVRASYQRSLGGQLQGKANRELGQRGYDLDALSADSIGRASAQNSDLAALRQLSSGLLPTLTSTSSKALLKLHKAIGKYQTTGKRQGGDRRKIQGHKVLGKLRGAYVFSVSGNSVLITNKVPWSGVLERGGAVGNGAVLPARPVLFFGASNLRELGDIAREELLK